MSDVLVCLSLLGAWTIVIAAAMTIYDVRVIRQAKALRRRPHARRWRSRPFIAVQYYGKPSLESLRSLRQGSYRHTAVTYAFHDLTLHLHGSNVLPKHALREANSQLQYRPRLRVIEIIPRPRFPQTTKQFFKAYCLFAIMPFIKVRSVLNIRPLVREWPTLTKQAAATSWRDQIYALGAWAVSVCNGLLLLYISYTAFAADQPTYLAAYLALFCLWLMWSILGHPQLTTWHKVVYCLLLPASLGYFLWRVLSAPLRPLLRVRTHALWRQMLS